jgi:hypothetical protein
VPRLLGMMTISFDEHLGQTPVDFMMISHNVWLNLSFSNRVLVGIKLQMLINMDSYLFGIWQV